MAGPGRYDDGHDEGGKLVLDIRVQDGTTLALTGRLDAAESDRALAEMQKQPGPLTLECSGLEYISSAGISVIMQTYKRLAAAGQTFRLVGMAPRVKNVFMYAGLDKLLGIQ